MPPRCDAHDFRTSRWGRAAKVKKNSILAGEVLQKSQIAFPRCMGVKQKNDSHAAWECQNGCFRHLSSEKANLKSYEIFVVDFGGFGKVQNWLT